MAFSSPTDAYTATDLAAVIPEIWSDILQEPKFPPATIINFVRDLTPYMVEGGDIVHVPDIFTNTFSVQTQSTQGNAVVDASVASVDTTLTVNTHKYVAWIIGDKDMKQMATKYSLNEAYVREAKRLLIRAIEDTLFALWSSITTNTVGDTATVLSDLEIRQSINKLDSTDYELSDCAWFFHPTVYWTQVAGIQKYYDANQRGEQSVVTSGILGTVSMKRGQEFKGMLYDMPVFTSSRVVSGLQTYRNLLLHKDAFGVAIQTNGGSIARAQMDYKLENLGTLAVVDTIYGAGVLREPGAVLVNANTTATTA